VKTIARGIALGSLLAAVLLVIAGGPHAVLGEHKDVADTQHGVASPGVPACVYCHVPRDAAGQLLWPSGEPDKDGPLSGQKRLCFSCHDGTVTKERSFVFDPGRPEHVRSPGARGQDCDRCHDAHGTGTDKFLKLSGDANFCRNCHFRAGPTDHPVGVNAMAVGIEPTDSRFDPKLGDYNGTRLWNDAGTGPGELVMCLSCHNPHGGAPGTKMLTVQASEQEGYFQALCLSCHPRN
jgi:predicted CXXCH cytochrome family protein